MGGKLSTDENVHVVIVGGGFGGTTAAKQLKAYHIPYTLIDIKLAFHHNMGALRASVKSGFAKKTFISYDLTFKEKFKQGKVTDIDVEGKYVILESGEEIAFSHLILSTGSSGPFPGKFIEPASRETAIQKYEDLVAEIQKADRIVVVGGGLAGVELAAEIKTEYHEKEVTLIHSTYILGDTDLLPSVRRGVKDILVHKGIQLVLGQKVTNLAELTENTMQPDITVMTNKGKEIVTDMVIRCTGIKINSTAYRNAFKDKVSDNGALQVNEYLQVKGLGNIYAIGDCADVLENKSAYTAEFQAIACVKNIIHNLKDQPMDVYKPGSPLMLVTMGRNDGVGQLCGCQVGKVFVTLVKSRDLLVKDSWKKMGQRMPN
ncbi:ferroptosis suppressor protein 1-like [Callorhinchus milii]|uniref:ferroptosis suppressor protein 1-like n=1 Tax=Callorhinchus milii TaxID=7868 RepID=UPI0004576069|nr:ferroptosis suppressor protein 1-like [Callorhinchus milii]|eukprot:gi/632936915/ref/XP_007896592.1/ PREDICTED: apoptosis-inducing factor 2-like [Callorhinchus milii]